MCFSSEAGCFTKKELFFLELIHCTVMNYSFNIPLLQKLEEIPLKKSLSFKKLFYLGKND
jgi:hypothetical protein